ncbi:neuropeptides capa receptor [Biomphalaria pfeifferi]|uniref:Neuropeptides capa receptor n=1 Tax=Biomphalaria pfeifferi TaxID=112525 RepID=A0AAD8F797_BIOPF|nr:neuropeptides capa receptor [Biomphalaria pfeifferi]
MSTSNLTTSSLNAPYFVLDPVLDNFFRVLNLCILSFIIGVFGIAANFINICVFRKLGYRDGVNITLTALAVSDIGALLSQEFYNILATPMIQEYDLFLTKGQLMTVMHYIVGYFVRVSSVITSFASLERCLCVVLPLKVKTIITPRVVVVYNVIIFLILSLYMFPPYYSLYLDIKFLPGYNKTIWYFFYQPYSERVLKISYNITDLVLPYGTFLVLLLCSSIMYIKIKRMSEWRRSISSAGSHATSKSSVKEMKSGVMLIIVSLLCICFLSPEAALFTAAGFVREMKQDGIYKGVTNLVISFTTLLQTINCSVTIVIYYNMSSKYRDEFHTIIQKYKPSSTFFCVKKHQ